MGSIRHVADMNTEQVSQESQGLLNQQLGTGKFATQKGMSMGKTRHVGDIDGGTLSQSSQGHVGLQAGSNKFATQKGMSFGKVRGISDTPISQVYDGYAPGSENGDANCARDAPVDHQYNGYQQSIDPVEGDISFAVPNGNYIEEPELDETAETHNMPASEENGYDETSEALVADDEEYVQSPELETMITTDDDDYNRYEPSSELEAMG